MSQNLSSAAVVIGPLRVDIRFYKVKVNLGRYHLNIPILIVVRILTLASTVFKKSHFLLSPHLNALRSKFDLGVK